MKYSYLVQKHMDWLYNGVCDIINYEKQDGVINNTIEVVKAENVPCRLSYESVKEGEQTDKATNEKQVIKLFLKPETDIKEGCKVVVTQEGETHSFCCAGKVAVYGSHKEIVLEAERKYA